MSDPARVSVVRLCIEELWESRSDGRFAALEDVLVDVLNMTPAAVREKPGGTRPRVSTKGHAALTAAGDNVISFAERVARMRRKA